MKKLIPCLLLIAVSYGFTYTNKSDSTKKCCCIKKAISEVKKLAGKTRDELVFHPLSFLTIFE